MRKLVLLAVVLALAAPLFGQSECVNLGQFAWMKTIDSSGVIHENICISPTSGKLTFPFGPSFVGVTFSSLTGAAGQPLIVQGGAGATNDFQVNNAAGTQTLLTVTDSGAVQLGQGGQPLVLKGVTSGTISLFAPALAGTTNVTFAPSGSAVTVAYLNSTQLWTSPQTLPNTVLSTGVSADASGFKHKRFGATCTTTASAGATCTTAVTWTTAFADANYTVTCVGITSANTPVLSIESIAAAGFTIRVATITAAASGYGGVDCIAAHD